MPQQLDVFGGSTPYGPPRAPRSSGQDPALAARLGRQQANRDRIEGKGASWHRNFAAAEDEYGNDIDPHNKPMSDYGIRNVHREVFLDKKNHVPYGPHDVSTFRKAGSVREVPLVGPDAITTMQDTVMPERVAELAKDPSMGSDPRFPGRELPLSVQMRLPHPEHGRPTPTDVLWNGNHRVAAAVERGEMFTPVQSISQDQMPRAAQTFRRDKARFAEARAERYDVGLTRMAKRDATIRYGIGDEVWDYMGQ